MVAFRRSSPFTHRHFTNKPRLVSPSGSSSAASSAARTSSSTEGSSSTSEDGTISKSRNSEYPIYLVIALLAALFVFAICNAVHKVNHTLAKRRRYERGKEVHDPASARPESSYDKPHFGLNPLYSYTAGYPEPSDRSLLWRWWLAIVNGMRILSFRKAPVALFKVLVGVAYLLLSLAFLLSNSKNTRGEYDASYWANRAGTLAVAQIAFIVALAMKNNIISVLIGGGFERLNFLHRIAGRTVCLLIWVHMIGHIILGLKKDASIEHSFMHAGVAATTALTLTVVIGIRPVRQKCYEFFLASHTLLILVFMLGGIGHVTASTKFLPYFYPAFILWAVDRALRLYRVILNRSQSRKTGTSTPFRDSDIATMHYNQASSPAFIVPFADGAVGVFVQLPCNIPITQRWRAGQLALLSIPAASKYGVSLESHPFSVASIDTSLQTFLSGELKQRSRKWSNQNQTQHYTVPLSGDGVIERSSSGSQYSLEELKLKSESGSEKQFQKPALTDELISFTSIFMRFIIHPRAGFTRRLRRLAEDLGSGAAVSAFVDGPYGCPPDVSAYEKVVLITGGSGVTFALPLLLDLVRRARLSPSTTICKHVIFIWTVRDPRQVEWIQTELTLLQTSPLSLIVKVHLYCTRDSWSIHQLHASQSQQQQIVSSNEHGNFQPPSRAFAAPLPVDPYTSYEVQPRPVPQRPTRTAPPLSSLLEDIPISPMEYGNTAHMRGTSGSESNTGYGYGSGRSRMGSGGGRERPAHVQRFTGRPNFEQIFRGRGSPLKDGGDVAVCVAGPRSMVNDVRRTLGRWDLAGPGRVYRGGANIFLHVESYGY